MRTLIYTAFVSLDGVVEAPAASPDYRNSGWTFKDIEFSARGLRDQGAGADGGRRDDDGPDQLRGVRPGVAGHGGLRRLQGDAEVRRLDHPRRGRPRPNWGDTTILRSLDDVAASKETDGGPIIIHGSATLSRNLSDAGLIDRYHLLVFPLLLGAGKRMFSDTDKDKQTLTLVESESYANGIQKLVYDVVR